MYEIPDPFLPCKVWALQTKIDGQDNEFFGVYTSVEHGKRTAAEMVTAYVTNIMDPDAPTPDEVKSQITWQDVKVHPYPGEPEKSITVSHEGKYANPQTGTEFTLMLYPIWINDLTGDE